MSALLNFESVNRLLFILNIYSVFTIIALSKSG